MVEHLTISDPFRSEFLSISHAYSCKGCAIEWFDFCRSDPNCKHVNEVPQFLAVSSCDTLPKCFLAGVSRQTSSLVFVTSVAGFWVGLRHSHLNAFIACRVGPTDGHRWKKKQLLRTLQSTHPCSNAQLVPPWGGFRADRANATKLLSESAGCEWPNQQGRNVAQVLRQTVMDHVPGNLVLASGSAPRKSRQSPTSRRGNQRTQ